MGRWRTMARELVCTPAILINWSARPPRAQGNPRLVAFSDGSSVAYAAAVYVIYWTSDNSYEAHLFLSKARVAPLNGMTVPRTEMNGLVIATKLIDLSLASMRELPSSVTFCLDSECTISAVDSENGLLKPYLTNRRAVVKGKLQEWQRSIPR